MATRISKLKWDEISGVDHPANETPGWILQKAAGEVADFETAIVELHKALGSDAAELFFKDADDKVRKAVSRVFKHLDESLEEVDDEDGDDEEKVEKRGLSKLAEILGATLTKSEDETSDDDDDSDESDDDDDDSDDESGDDADDEDESGDETSDEDDEDKGGDEDGEDDEPVSKSSKLQKSDVDAIVSAFKEELDPIREAVGALADRTDGLEKHAAGRTSLLGQDGSEDSDEDDEKAGLHKAFTGAIRSGEKITLT